MALNSETPTISTERNSDQVGIDSIVRSINLDGSRVGLRYLVEINGEPFPLRSKSLMYLAILAFHRVNDSGDGWVGKGDLESGENQIKYLYQLRNEMRRKVGEVVVLDYSHVVENNKQGAYRLGVDPQVITFNRENLGRHDDFRIRRLFTQVKS